MLLNIPCKFWFVVLSSPFCPKFFIRKTLKDLSWVLFSGNTFVLIVFDTCPAEMVNQGSSLKQFIYSYR